MDERVLRLIKQINLEDKYSNYFEGSKLDRVVVYDNDKMWEFIIILNKNIPYDLYVSFLIKLREAFPKPELVNLIFKVENGDNSLLKECYNEIKSCGGLFSFNIFALFCVDRCKCRQLR